MAVQLAAYILLGDPAWLPVSIASYYSRVSTIVASYDENFRSWSGCDMRVEMEACLRLLDALDTEDKVIRCPGPFSVPGEHPQLGETRQRQFSLDTASQDSEWVLQLDTDEVASDIDLMLAQIDLADRESVDGLEYPARWLYSHVRGRWYLEMGTRRLQPWNAIPGPVAVRAGTRLSLARQADVPQRRLRFGSPGSQSAVPLDSAILHFSMVRAPAAMHAKARTSPHAPDFDWTRRLRLWERAMSHPLLAVVESVLRPEFGSFRPARLPAEYGDALVASQTALGDPNVLAGAGTTAS